MKHSHEVSKSNFSLREVQNKSLKFLKVGKNPDLRINTNLIPHPTLSFQWMYLNVSI